MNTIVNDGIELTREERKQRFIDNYRLNLAPDTSIRKTIKSGRELLEFAKQHAEKKDYHFKNGGYVPTQGLMLKQDIEDVICYYISSCWWRVADICMTRSLASPEKTRGSSFGLS